MSDKIAISKEELQEQRKHYERYRERAVLVSKSQLNSAILEKRWLSTPLI
jgi:hypothetical protein